jgi:hypothetical protein
VALEALATTVTNAWSDDRTLREVHGWNNPALTRHDLSAIPKRLANKIRIIEPENIEEDLLQHLSTVPARLSLLQSETVPHMFDGNGASAVPAYIATINFLSASLEPILGWVANPDIKLMPASLARRLRSYQATLDGIAPNKEKLTAQITQIREATEAAETLPTDLEALKEAKLKVDKFASDAAELYGKLDERSNDTFTLLKKISDYEKEADKLVQQCEQAYRITTTKGLAAAFTQRASLLGRSMWIWVIGLVLALAAAGYLGAERVTLLSTALSGSDPKWGAIWIQLILSALSVGAPLWFAWVATKQIGERFRLAEDYGFKASVAKAYEGYRREAARIDPAFEARLFSSALSRLEEAPLRLVETKTHGSPWHELVNSQVFRDAMTAIPELGNKFTELTKRRIPLFKDNGKPIEIEALSGNRDVSPDSNH